MTAVVVYTSTNILVEPSKVQSYKSVLKCTYFANFHLKVKHLEKSLVHIMITMFSVLKY
jgi:hypothetical protein